ncbi:uncharacterized protein LOC128547871 [Mercenaria mercenaria]|uniref:uncharacterized protein LOC128547871 n=1 Tax=Mercenaria mercenaria TaxID=6596 RepID=UPI00234ECBE7|nr:uncharacterized protein LOC128547871 [Mercenaria mercenaria]
MDILVVTKFCIILAYISHVNTDLKINVTKAQCGRTFDIAAEESLVLDYDGGDLGQNNGGLCVITVQNNNNDTMICIQTNSTRTRHCSSVFNYHVGNTPPGLHTIGYTCHDFYVHPLCARRTPVFAAFRPPTDFSIARVNVAIYIANQTYFTTSTSSSLLTESETSNIIIGLVVGVVSIVILLAVCATYRRRKNMSEDQLEQSYNMYSQANQPSCQQVVSSVSQQYSLNTEVSDYQTSIQQGGHHVHPAANITVTGYDERTARQNNSSPPPGGIDQSDPPPPYPGY